MLSTELMIFCEHWLTKVDRYTDNNTEDTFAVTILLERK